MKNLFFRRLIVRVIFGYADFICGIFISKKNYVDPRRILISNIAHMGDFVISISAINKIIETFPCAEIGLLCSSESAEIAEGIVNHEKVYILRHWKLNRCEDSIFKKIYLYFTDLYDLTFKLRNQNYDLAIDLYPYYPNSMLLLWLARVKFRVGFASGGLSNLSSLSYDIEVPLNKHITEYQKNLLMKFFNKCLFLNQNWIIQKYFQKWNFSKKPIVEINNYYIFQIGAGAKEKRWSAKAWGELINNIDAKIVLVGKGKEDLNYYREIENFINKNTHVINLINKLSFQNLVDLVSKSSFVIAGDSLLTHLAYGMNIPQVCILSNEKKDPLWINNDVKIIYKPSVVDILNLVKVL